MNSIFTENIRKIAGIIKESPERDKLFHIEDVKIFFSAPKPSKPTLDSLTNRPDTSMRENFQWVDYQILFKVMDRKGNDPKYYIYDMPLSTDGTKKSSVDFIYDSDSNWNPEKIKSKIPTEDKITTGDVIRSFPKILKGPSLDPDKYAQTVYVNTDKSDMGKTYSAQEFKKLFDNNFYIVLNPSTKALKNPLGKIVGTKG